MFSIVMMDKFRIDDPVGAISVHGTVGMWGLLAVPLTNPDASFGPQLYGLVVIFGWTFVASIITWVILKVVALMVPLRVTDEDETVGLDITAHEESGYNI